MSRSPLTEHTVGGSVPKAAIAASSLRRWPTEVTPMLIRSSAVSSRQHLAIDIIVAEGRRVLFEAQPAQPRRYVHAVILGSEERQPLMDEDIPLPFDLPAAALK